MKKCVCGSLNFKVGNVYLSPTMPIMGIRCLDCQRQLSEIRCESDGIVIAPRDVLPGKDADGNETMGMLTKAHIGWVEMVWLAQVKDLSHRRREFKLIEWRTWLKDVFYPKFPNCTDYPKGGTTFSYLPEDAKQFINEITGKDFDKRGYHLRWGDELCRNVIPACIPDSLIVLAWDDTKKDYVEVDREASQSIEIPPDPRRIRNLTILGGMLTKRLIVYSLIPNGYDQTSPEDWFQFKLPSGQEVVMGQQRDIICLKVRNHTAKQVEVFRSFGTKHCCYYGDYFIHARGSVALGQYLDALLAVSGA